MGTGMTPEGMPDTVLAALQAAMLRSALRGTPLPGGTEPLALPDRAFLTHTGPALLLDENLAPGLAGALPHDVRVVPAATLTSSVGEGGAYLRFQPPSREGETVWLTLELRLTRGASGEQPLGLGGVQAGFRRDGDTWRLAEPPRAFAM